METVLEAYLDSIKLHTVSLFIVDGRQITEGARSDFGLITHEQVFAFMNTNMIDKWIKVNEELGLRGFQDFGAFQLKLQVAEDGNDPEFAQQIRELRVEEKEKLSFCLNTWNKAFHSFIGRIESQDTLELLLKCFDQAHSTSLADIIGNDSAASVLEDRTGEIKRVADFIRQKLSDISDKKLLNKGVLIEGTLLTSLTRRQWRCILDDLAEWGYIEKLSNVDNDAVDSWLDHAFSFVHEKSLKTASKILLYWPNPSSLTELIMKFIEVGAIIHDVKDYTRIYGWIDRSIKFRSKGKSNSVRTIFRTYEDRKMNCFEVRLDENGKFSFKVLVPARKYKA